jgi:hypothetical protein
MTDQHMTFRTFRGFSVFRPRTLMVSGLILAATTFAGCFNGGPVDASGGQTETRPNLDDWKVNRTAKADLRGRSLGDVMLHPKGRKGGTEPR